MKDSKYFWLTALTALVVGASLGEAQQLPVSVQAEWGEGFGYISAVRELPDGRVLVADPLGQMLVAIDMVTGAMETWGREGSGPKEWRQPDAVYALPGGETLLVDLGNGRLVKISADGSFGRTYPIARGGGGGGGGRFSPPTMVLPRVVDDQGSIYFGARSFMSLDDSTVVTRTGLDDETMHPMGKAKPQAMRQSDSGGNIDISPLPMTPEDDWSVGADGTVVFVRSDGYYLEIVRPDGTTVRGSAQDVDLLRPSDDDKLAYMETRAAAGIRMSIRLSDDGAPMMSMTRGGGGGTEPDITEFDWPRRMPAFRPGSTSVAPDGRVFVGRFVHAGEPSLYDVFDLNGELMGHTEFGPNASIVGFGVDGALYVTEVDMFGLQWLKKVTVG